MKQNKYWLFLSIIAVAIAGIFSLIPVILRAFKSSFLIGIYDLFRTSLVIHVDLSIIVWMLLLACFFTQRISKNKQINFISLVIAGLGILMISIAPIFGGTKPSLNNYIPMLQNLPFIFGLSCFLTAVLLVTGNYFINSKIDLRDLEGSAIFWNNLIILMAFGSAIVVFLKLNSYMQQKPLTPEYFYEILFWSAGHLIQFSYSQLGIIAWMLIANKVNSNILSGNNHNPLKFALALNALIASIGFVATFILDINGEYYIEFFTNHMRYGGGIASIVAFLYITYLIVKAKPTKSYYLLVYASSGLLFFSGGTLGFLIRSSDAITPAHYHGSIIAVTLALMAVVLDKLPSYGYKKICPRLIAIQAILYSLGQFMHIVGLAIAGGYGALRKTPGSIPTLGAKYGMILVGIGGIFAIIAGFMFIFLAIKSILKKDNEQYNRRRI